MHGRGRAAVRPGLRGQRPVDRARCALEPLLDAAAACGARRAGRSCGSHGRRRTRAAVDDRRGRRGRYANGLSRRRYPIRARRWDEWRLSYVDRERSYLNGAVTAIAPRRRRPARKRVGSDWFTLDLGGARAMPQSGCCSSGSRNARHDRASPRRRRCWRWKLATPSRSRARPTGRSRSPRSAMDWRGRFRRRRFRRRTGRCEPEQPASGRRRCYRHQCRMRCRCSMPRNCRQRPTDVARSRLALGAFAQPWPGSVSVDRRR